MHESLRRKEKYDTKARECAKSPIKRKVTCVVNYKNLYDLGQSNQTSKCDDKINPKRNKSPSKTCRFSKYIDILQTPLSTLERSLSKKKRGDTVKNEKKEIQMQTSTQYQQTGSVKKDTGYLIIFNDL